MKIKHLAPLLGILTCATPARSATGASWSLVASDWGGDRLIRIDPKDLSVSQLTAPGAGGLDNPSGVALSATGELLVGNGWTNDVRRFDPDTGAYKGVFATGLAIPIGVHTTNDGHVLVASRDGHGVFGFNSSGTPTGNYILQNNTALRWAYDVEVMPDGDLIVSSFERGSILRFDGTTRAYEGTFSPTNNGYAAGMAWGPDGDLYVARYNGNRIDRIDRATGAVKGVFASGNSISKPSGICFAPDGRMYVANDRSPYISIFSSTTGQAITRVLMSSDPQAGTDFIAVVPEPGTALIPLGLGFFVRRKK